MSTALPARPRALFVTDLDGTLFDPANELPPRNLAALERAARSGVAVAVVTGRRFASFRKETGKLGALAYRAATSCGGVVLAACNARAEAVRDIPWEACLDLAHAPALRAAKVIGVAAPLDGVSDAFVIEPGSRRLHISDAPWGGSHRPVERSEALARPLVHVAFVAPTREQAEGWEPLVRAAFGERAAVHALRYPSGTSAGTEVVAAGGKGNAVRHLVERLGVDPAATAGIGDEMNDALLLDAVRFRYAVGGSELARRRPDARALGSAGEGAVADALELFLEELGEGRAACARTGGAVTAPAR